MSNSHLNVQRTQIKRHVRSTAPVEIQVEDDRTGMDIETLKRAFIDNLYYIQGKDKNFATSYDYYMALAYTIRDRLVHRWIKTEQTYFEKDVRVVCYLSAEFLLGRQLGQNLINVGLWERARQAIKETAGLELEDLMEHEQEPGLGNGGLGRLAACFLDSLATLEIPALGYGICYEFGIFKQDIRDGWQAERPDTWLQLGNPWEIPRPEYRVKVNFGGHTDRANASKL
jgi:glycogen phosphorylase